MTGDARRSLEDFTRSLRRGDDASRTDLAEAAAGRPMARSFGLAAAGTKSEPASRPEGLPKGLVIGLEAAAILLVIAAVVLGPPFYTCQRQKNEGQFYYGMTVRACMRARVVERTASAEAYLRGLTGAR